MTTDRIFRPGLAGLIFLVLWALLIRQLAVHWNINPQYSYGWLVPFLAAYLLQRRWSDRPAVTDSGWSGANGIAALAAFAIFPTWLVAQPNPDWRLVSWALAMEVIVLTLCGIYFSGGRSWALHFAFPFCFVLTAVPWPSGLEPIVVQNLMRIVAAVTVDALGFLGIPAVQQGSVIEIKNGLLGIDEACSGVRSLQATLMATLFLGELYRCTLPRRAVLVISGIALALCCNIGRALFLAWHAANEGMESVKRFHDPAGYTILTICFILVWIIALFIAGPSKPAVQIPTGERRPRPLPTQFVVALGIWLIASFSGVEVWYRIHERKADAGKQTSLTFDWPTNRGNFRELQIEERAMELLQFDNGRGASWKESDNTRWTAFYFKWNAGPARSRILARMHRPDICLPASGCRMQEDHGVITFDVNGVPIPFSAFTFVHDGRPIQVFYCAWQDRPKDGSPTDSRETWSRLTGLDSVLHGERQVGQQAVVEFILEGYPTIAEAEAALRQQISERIRL